MPKSDNQKLKILYILDYLQKNSNEDSPVRAGELIAMLEKHNISKGYANVIEQRLDDTCCTMESVLEDNANMLVLAQQYQVNYVLIEDEYEIDVEV